MTNCQQRPPGPTRALSALTAAAIVTLTLALAGCQSPDATPTVYHRPAEHLLHQANPDDPARIGRLQAQSPLPEPGPTTTPQHLRWPTLTEAEHAEAIAQLAAFADRAAAKLDTPLERHESQYFLLFTDLPADDAERWASLLDRMYMMLLFEFGLPSDENLWRGKAMVLVFRQADDYRRFQREVHNTDPAGSIGMCHNFASGNVHIAFYHSDDDDRRFARILAHEAAHGFIHRYRSRTSVASWINEGFAEWVAHRLVPDSAAAQNVVIRTRDQLRQRGSLEGFFDADRIEPWQYGVAFTLTEHMIKQDREGYIAFFKAVKDGIPWRDAMEQHFGMTADQLLADYAQTVNVPNLQP